MTVTAKERVQANLSQDKKRRPFLFIMGFSLIFANILAFLFEGRVLYNILDSWQLNGPFYIMLTMAAHFLGLLFSAYFIRGKKASQRVLAASVIFCFLLTLPFLLSLSLLGKFGLVLSGFFSGTLISTLGYFLKAYIRKEDRYKTIADILIFSNLAMTLIYLLDTYLSASLALMVSLFSLLLGSFFLYLFIGKASVLSQSKVKSGEGAGVARSLALLFVFILVITLNSGIMYQVIRPSYQHLTRLTAWYWALPYVVSVFSMRQLSSERKRSPYLYLALIMLMLAFVAFVFLENTARAYLLVNTLLLASFGIFDLFWWTILAEMLDYTDRPNKIFGLGLSANVLGVLIGGVLGYLGQVYRLTHTEIVVFALVVLCASALLLPFLNQRLALLLKHNAYLITYKEMVKAPGQENLNDMLGIDLLTGREKDVLKEILYGKTNRLIAEKLCISESTVKTHAGNIYLKYQVKTRAELISLILGHYLQGM